MDGKARAFVLVVESERAGQVERKAAQLQGDALQAKEEDEDEDGLPAGYVNPMSQTYGSDKDIAPAKRADDGWDPRQW